MEFSQNTYGRVAILIGCAGKRGNNYLHGVSNDLTNFRRFLRSPRSGCFYDNEIHTLEDATLDDVLDAVASVKAQYCVLYFSGHGYTDARTNQRMLCLRDCNVPDTFLKTNSKTELVIVDACRNYLPAISGISEYIEPYSSFTGSMARQRFDEFIMSSNAGRQIVYGTQRNEVSIDSHNGGLFTYNLLDTASTIKINLPELAPVYLKELLPYVKHNMNSNREQNQIPDVVLESSYYNMPFLINAQQIKVEQTQVRQTRNRVIKKENNPVGGLIVTGLVAWGLISIFKSSKG